MKEIRTTQELNEILGSGKSAFIKIGAPWCGPCSQIQRTILDIEGGYTVDYDFYEVDADQSDEDLVSRLSVFNLPTIVIYNKKGEEVFRKSGLLTRAQLTSLLDELKNK